MPSIRAKSALRTCGDVEPKRGQGIERSFTDWRELIRSVEGLEAVAITTPPGPRYEIARECILAGLHCLLEKPPTAGLAPIAALAGLADAATGQSLHLLWHAQHHPAVDAAARALAGKRIASLAIQWHEDVRKWHPGQAWIWEPGGFGVFDPGINAFSIATRIFPGPLFVRQADLKRSTNGQTPIAVDTQFASPQADGPLHANLDWRRTEGEEWTITARTTDGHEVRLTGGGGRTIARRQARIDPGLGEYPDIYARFVDLIDERRSEVDIAYYALLPTAASGEDDQGRSDYSRPAP